VFEGRESRGSTDAIGKQNYYLTVRSSMENFCPVKFSPCASLSKYSDSDSDSVIREGKHCVFAKLAPVPECAVPPSAQSQIPESIRMKPCTFRIWSLARKKLTGAKLGLEERTLGVGGKSYKNGKAFIVILPHINKLTLHK